MKAPASRNGAHPAPSAGPASPEPRMIPLSLIDRSPLNPRKTFDEEDLARLGDTIKSYGILQPLLLRPKVHVVEPGPTKGSHERYELVDGERRWRAALLVNLMEVPAVVRELSDKEVLEIALVTCEQRADVPLLEKARGYQRLLRDHNYTVDSLALMIGRSRETVYGLQKALNAPDSAIEAFEEGKIGFQHLVLLGRIPGTAMREKAAKQILQEGDGEPLSHREAKEMIEQDFMVELKGCAFDRKSLTLLPPAGSCDACKKQTGNNREEYPEGRADVCTDPECYRAKVAAHKKMETEKAQAKGVRVLSAGDAKKALSFGGGWIDLKDPCWSDPGRRTFKQVLGESVKEHVALAHDAEGRAHYVVPREQANEVLREKGIIKEDAGGGRVNNEEMRKKMEKEREFEEALREAVLDHLFEQARKNPAAMLRPWLKDRLLYEGTDDTIAAVAKVVKVALPQGADPRRPETIDLVIKGCADGELVPALIWLWLDQEFGHDVAHGVSRCLPDVDVDLKAMKVEVKASLKAKAQEAKRQSKETALMSIPEPQPLKEPAAFDFCSLHAPKKPTSQEYDEALRRSIERFPMQIQWRVAAEQGATDNEINDLVLLQYGDAHNRGNDPHCTWVTARHGKSPRFWFGKDMPEGKPTLEGNALIKEIRRLKCIPARSNPEGTKKVSLKKAAANGVQERLQEYSQELAGDETQIAALPVDESRCRACERTEEETGANSVYWVEPGLCYFCVAKGVEPLTDDGKRQAMNIRTAADARKRKALKTSAH